MALTVIDELVTILGFDIKTGAKAVINSFNQALDTTTRGAGWAAGALTAAAASVSFFMQRTNAASSEIYRFRQLTGDSTDKLQAWQYAADAVGVSSDALAGDLLSLTKSMSSPIPGEYNEGLFMLGVSAHRAGGGLKTANELLLDISDKFQGMSPQRQLQWASRLGISDDTLILLQSGRREIQALFEQARNIPTIVDEKQLKAAREFTIQVKLMRRVMTYLGQTIASSAGPVMKTLVSSFMEFLKQNREFIQIGLRNVIDGIAWGFMDFWESLKGVRDSLFELFPGLRDFVRSMGDAEKIALAVKVALIAVSAALVALGIKLAIALWPWALLTAAIAAAYLVFDDIMTYFKGGKSITGELIEKIKELAATFKNRFPGVIAFLEETWDWLRKIATWTGGKLVNIFESLWGTLKNVKEALSGPVGALIKSMVSAIDKAMSFTLGDFLFGGGMPQEYWGPQPDEIPNWMRVPEVRTGGSTTINNNLNQNIQGPHATGIADEVKRKAFNFFFSNNPGDFAPVAQ